MTGSTPSCQHRASVAGNTFPPIGRIARNISAGLALSLPLAITWAQPAQAVLIFNFYESGGNLVVEGTGLLNLPSSPLNSVSCFFGSPGVVFKFREGFCTGASSSVNVYGINGPITLGPSGSTTSTISAGSSSNSGIALGLIYRWGEFGIDPTYVSGTPISSSSTFTGITLASLGMPATGTLGTWTLLDPNDSSYVGDTIEVQVNASSGGSLASVPGPLPILGVAAAFGFSRKLRKRIQLHKGSSVVSTTTGS